MKRLFWTGLGVTVGVLVTRKATRAVEQFTPTGMADNLAVSIENLGAAIRQFGQDVREGMWDREDELRDALGLNDVESDHAHRSAGWKTPDPAR